MNAQFIPCTPKCHRVVAQYAFTLSPWLSIYMHPYGTFALDMTMRLPLALESVASLTYAGLTEGYTTLAPHQFTRL